MDRELRLGGRAVLLFSAGSLAAGKRRGVSSQSWVSCQKSPLPSWARGGRSGSRGAFHVPSRSSIHCSSGLFACSPPQLLPQPSLGKKGGRATLSCKAAGERHCHGPPSGPRPFPVPQRPQRLLRPGSLGDAAERPVQGRRQRRSPQSKATQMMTGSGAGTGRRVGAVPWLPFSAGSGVKGWGLCFSSLPALIWG